MSDEQGNGGGSGEIPGLPPRPHRGWTFDEQPVGKRWSTSRRTITETDLVVYATQFGFAEGLFLDATAAERAGYGGRLVPGSLVMSLAEGLIISGGAIAGTGVAYLGAAVEVRGPDVRRRHAAGRGRGDRCPPHVTGRPRHRDHAQ